MPLAAILVGFVLIDLAFRGTEHAFAKQLGQDFGQGTQFWSWAAAIAILGALGYTGPLRKLSDAMLALVIIVLVLSHGGLFEQIASLINTPPAPAPAIPLSQYSSSSSSGSSSSGSSGSTLSSLGAVAQFAALL